MFTSFLVRTLPLNVIKFILPFGLCFKFAFTETTYKSVTSIKWTLIPCLNGVYFSEIHSLRKLLNGLTVEN